MVANVAATADPPSDKPTHNTPMAGLGITMEQQQLLSVVLTQGAAPLLKPILLVRFFIYKKSRECMVESGASHDFISHERRLPICMT